VADALTQIAAGNPALTPAKRKPRTMAGSAITRITILRAPYYTDERWWRKRDA